MPISYIPAENSKEPSQASSPALSVEQVGNISATLDPGSLPALLEAQDNLDMLHHHPNFFVLGTSYPDDQSMPPRASNALPQQEELNGEAKSEMQTQAVALSIPARSETLFKTLLGRLRLGRGYLETRLKTVEVALVVTRVPVWLETVVVIIGLIASFTAHAINMFNYPHYEQDEGTYLMYAWAVTHGRIDPYPYGYGHPPLAWMQIAAWAKLIGGFSTFGNAINSGRVLVLLFAVGSTLLVYQIARHLGASLTSCLLSMAIFTLSPLSITFQREVLLDNFATFWFLLSLYLVVVGKSRLFYTMAAAICVGISLLSKEVLVVLFPAMIYVVLLYTERFQRRFALVAFIYTVIAAGSTFILMATLKGELFPYSWHLPWDHHQHLSLIDTFIGQAHRGQGDGSIIDSWNAWIKGDPLLIAIGIAAPIFNLIAGWWSRKHLFLSLLAFSFWALLGRGGVVFAFYIIPLIPFIALNTVLALNTIVGWIGRLVHFELVGVILILGALVALIHYDIQHSLYPYNLFTQRPALVENEALIWIRANVSHRAVIVVNPNLYTDLHEEGSQGVGDGAIFPYANVYWFVALDPELHDTLLKGNWDRIDYIVVDSEMLNDIKHFGGGMDLIKTALEHSVLRKEFKGDNYEFIQIYQVIHITPPPET